MSRTISLVQRVEIASPCSVPWDQMTGNETVRFCSECRLNVYNLSAMTSEEGERLIRETEGRLCARIYRRRDGTILTRDCPVGLRAMRRRVISVVAKVAAVLAFIGTSLFAASTAPSPNDRYVNRRGGLRPTTYHQTAAAMMRWLSNAPAPRPQTGWVGGVVVLQNGSSGCKAPSSAVRSPEQSASSR